LQLFASASLLQCGKVINGDLSYKWRAYNGFQLVDSFSTASLDPRTFLLTPYTLDANSVYTFQVTVSIIGFPKQSAIASVEVRVGLSGVSATILGGSGLTWSTSADLTLNATTSYDIDYPNVQSLRFSWRCLLYSPNFGSSCPSSIILQPFPQLYIPAGTISLTASPSISLTFTVIVTNVFNISSSTSILVTYKSGDFSTVMIVPPPSKYSSSSMIVVDAKVKVPEGQYSTATWSTIDIPESSLISGSVVSLQRTFSGGLSYTFPLMLEAFALSPGTTYAFTLSAATLGSSSVAVASVVVVTNSPPTGGVLKVTPSSGVSLQSVRLLFLINKFQISSYRASYEYHHYILFS